MKLLVVSLQKIGNERMAFSHALVEITKETRTSYCVVPHASVGGRKYIRQSDIDKVVIETDGENIKAKVMALNEVEDLSHDLLRYWKSEVRDEMLRYLKKHNKRIKQAYQEVINL